MVDEVSILNSWKDRLNKFFHELQAEGLDPGPRKRDSTSIFLQDFDELMRRKIGELQMSPEKSQDLQAHFTIREPIKWLPRVEILKANADSGYRLYAHAKIGSFVFVSETKDFPDRSPIGDNPTPEEWRILGDEWQKEFEKKALLYINDTCLKELWATLEDGVRSRAEFDLDKLVRMILKTKKQPSPGYDIIPPVQLNNILIEIVKGLRLQEEVFQLLNYRLDLYEDRFNIGIEKFECLLGEIIKNLEDARVPWWRKFLRSKKISEVETI